MFKTRYHPKAFLTLKRNVHKGLLARTRIILILEKKALNVKELARRTGKSYGSVIYHLHLLETADILRHKGKKPYSWELTGAGQQRLTGIERNNSL